MRPFAGTYLHLRLVASFVELKRVNYRGCSRPLGRLQGKDILQSAAPMLADVIEWQLALTHPLHGQRSRHAPAVLSTR